MDLISIMLIIINTNIIYSNLQLIYQMSFNVYPHSSSTSPSLLQWLNLEKSARGIFCAFVSFAQVLEDNFLSDILVDIDPIAFEEFADADSPKKMDILQKYLHKQFGKRIKWGYKQSINGFSSIDHIRQFSKLVCYFSIHSRKKNEYVGRILGLCQASQRSLMEEMQKMEAKMENITEIKEIIEEIEFLQCQNDLLKMKLEQMTRVNSQMLDLLKDTESENKTLKTQIEAFRREKSDIFAALEIDYISEYLQAYKNLQKEREKCQDLLEESERKLEDCQSTIRALNDRIKCDSVVISNLNDEVGRLKEISYQNQGIGQCFGTYSNSKFNLLSAGSNKENMSKCSTMLGKSMQIPTEWQGFTEIEDQINEKLNMRSHNQQLLSNLQQMYKKYTQVTAETTQLKQANKKLTRTNNGLRNLLKQVQAAYQQFQYHYFVTKTETNQAMDGLRVRSEYLFE